MAPGGSGLWLLLGLVGGKDHASALAAGEAIFEEAMESEENPPVLHEPKQPFSTKTRL